MYLKGYSFYRIKQELENRHIKTPCGKDRWHQTTIKNMLQNEKYCGDALLQKEYTVDFLTKKRKKNEGELNSYYLKDAHEAIVSHEVFNAVKCEMETRNIKYAGTNIITSKLRCGYCGGTMTRKLIHSKDKYKRFVYRCFNRYSGSRDCDNRYVREEYIKDEFVKAVNKLLADKKDIIKELELIVAKLCNESELFKELNDKNKRMEDVSSEIEKLVNYNSNKISNQETYKMEYSKLESEYNMLRDSCIKIEDKIEDIGKRKIKLECDIENYKNAEVVKEFSEELWVTILEKALVYENEIKFVWKSVDGGGDTIGSEIGDNVENDGKAEVIVAE